MMIKDPVIGIIGGNGLMGRMFAGFFEKNGFKVLVSSRSAELKPEECASSCDVLVISVPIDVTAEVIGRLGPLVKKEGLIMDLTSLKTGPMKAMTESASCSVVGTHPIFGPGVKSFKNQTVVVCPGRGKDWENWLTALLRNEGAKVKVSTAEEHDRMMAVIQGLMHFTAITMSHVLKDLKIDIRESLEYSSPIYKLRLDMVGRILNQDPGLYGSIEIMNPETPKVLDLYIETSRKLLDLIAKKDIKGFLRYFKEAADYLGDFKDEATEYSNYIINLLVDK